MDTRGRALMGGSREAILFSGFFKAHLGDDFFTLFEKALFSGRIKMQLFKNVKNKGFCAFLFSGRIRKREATKIKNAAGWFDFAWWQYCEDEEGQGRDTPQRQRRSLALERLKKYCRHSVGKK